MNIYEQIHQQEEEIARVQKSMSDLMFSYHEEMIHNNVVDRRGIQLQIAQMDEQLKRMQAKLDYVKGQVVEQGCVNVANQNATNQNAAGAVPIPAPAIPAPAIPAPAKSAPAPTAPAIPVPEVTEAAFQNQVPAYQNQGQSSLENSINAVPTASEKGRNVEQTFGKVVMGIVASVLIFISFVLFGVVVYPLLPDIAKMAILYGISAVFLGVGLWRLHKTPGHPLWISIAGCGVGGIYISLFMSDIQFHILNDIVLYILLFVWCGLVIFLSRQKSIAFQIIGDAGIFVSVVFGVVKCTDEENQAMLLFLIIYTVLSLLMMGIFNLQPVFRRNLPFVITSAACSLPLILTLYEFADTGMSRFYIIEVCVLSVYFLAQLLYAFIKKKEEQVQHIALGVSVFLNICLWMMTLGSLKYEYGGNVTFGIMLAVTLLIHAGIEIAGFGRKDAGRFINVILVTCLYFGLVWAMDNLKWLLPILAVSYIAYAEIRCLKIYKFFSFILFIAFIPATGDMPAVALLLSLIYIAALYVAEFVSGHDSFEGADIAFVSIGYVIGLTALSYSMSMALDSWNFVYDAAYKVWGYESHSADWMIAQIVNAVICGINAAVMLSPVCRHPVTKERVKPLFVLSIIINACIMIGSIVLICDAQSIFAILIGLAAFTLTTKKLLDCHKFWPAMYVGLKYTVLMWVSLVSLNAVSIVVSIILFVLALISIVTGFILKQKGLRIYGLILSLFSVAKLIIFDITYEKPLARAGSFFVCGIICFAISFIYSRVDKKNSGKS